MEGLHYNLPLDDLSPFNYLLSFSFVFSCFYRSAFSNLFYLSTSIVTLLLPPDQTRHNFLGEIRIFSVKIRINPYPSFMHRCIAKTFTRCIWRCSLQKNRDTVIKIDSQQKRTQNGAFTSRGATVGLGLHLSLTRSIVLHRSEISRFFRKFSGKR